PRTGRAHCGYLEPAPDRYRAGGRHRGHRRDRGPAHHARGGLSVHLPKPFYRLPRRFDVERLRAEVAALPAAAWAPHPNGVPGNSSVRLISAEGGENDRVEGEMRETAHLAQTPYIRQLLASFAVPWSRTRLLRLAPGANVPQHADINYHWFYRV